MKPSIQKKLQMLAERHEELGMMLAEPQVINDQNRFREYSKEYSQLETIVETFKSYLSQLKANEEAHELLQDTDPEMQQLAKAEIKKTEEKIIQLEEKLQVLLLPRDRHDESNIFLEIRAGAGGDEAAIFAGDLYR